MTTENSSSSTTAATAPNTQSNMFEKVCPVQVVVRSRPLNEIEKKEGAHSILTFPTGKELCVNHKSKGISKTYTFDHSYGPDSAQTEIYQNTIAPIVNEMLKGFNCTIFAYGQTGTGKTFTMEGNRTNSVDSATNVMEIHTDAGIIPRAAYHIFSTLEKSSSEYTVRVSFLELYNEELVDLLGSSAEGLKIFEDNGRKGVTVHNLEEVPVNSADDIFKILDRGFKKRQVAETNLNKNSSRSHCIFSIIVHTKESTPEGEDLLKVGKLNLVDLAGSENVGRSGAQNMRKREAGMINQSLLTLGRVITALTEHQPHIPYRESKLTRLLQDSLGGKTKTCIIATVSPSHAWLEETLSTLDYAHRAKSIKNKPEVNQKMTKRALIKEYMQEIERLRNNLAAARDGTGFYIAKETYDDLEIQIQTSKDKIEELENQLQGNISALQKLKELFEEKDAEFKKKSKQYEDTKSTLDRVTVQLTETVANLAQTKDTLEDHKLVLVEHEATEKQLFENATSLVQSLTSSISDVEGLHSKIDRKKATEEENKRKIGEFCKYLLKRLNGLEERTTQFENEQLKASQQFSEKISTFVNNKNQVIDHISHKLDSFMSTVTKTQGQLRDLSQSVKEATLRNMDRLSAENNGHVSMVDKQVEEFITESTTMLASLKQSLLHHQDEISDWSKQRTEETRHKTATVQSFKEDLQTQLSNLKSETSSVLHDQFSRIQEQQHILDELARRQREEMDTFKSQLMSQIAQACNAYTELQSATLASSLANVKKSIAHNLTDLQSLGSTTEESLVDSSKKLDVYYDSFIVTSKQDQERLSSLLQGTEGSISGMINKSEQLGSFTSSSLEQLLQHEKNWQVALTGVTSTEINNSTDHFERQQSCVDAWEQYDSQLVADMKSDLASTIDSLQVHSKQCTSDVEQTVHLASSLREKQASDVTQVKGDVTRFFSTLKEDKPTGTTPIKKKVHIPVDIPKPLPTDVLLSELSRKKSHNNQLPSGTTSINKQPMTMINNNKENILNNC